MNVAFSYHCAACGSTSWSLSEEWRGFQLATCAECGLKFTMSHEGSIGKKLRKGFAMARYYKNWPKAVLDRFRMLPREPVIYRLRSGEKLIVFTGTYDIQVINEIWIDRIYNPWTDMIPAHWTVVDFGAHRGVFVVFAARQAKVVYAVEANPEAATICLANITLNDLQSKVILLEGAISSKAGTAEFYVAEDAGLSSMIKRELVRIKRTMTVDKLSIYQLFQKLDCVNLLKVDIEGGEFELFLKSDLHQWLPKVERLAMEYHGDPGDLCKAVSNLGFDVILRPQRNLLYASCIRDSNSGGTK